MTRKLKILHLEDNDNDSELVKMAMKEAFVNYDYKRVDNENDFIKCLGTGKFNMVLSDYSLPSYNGLTALDRAVELQPEIPFIFISGTIGEDAAVESMKKGATDYVLKNNLAKLIPTIHRALREVSEKERRKEAQARYRILIESARDIIYTLSSKGTLISLNKAFGKITGLDQNDWIGKEFIGLIHQDDRSLAFENFHASIQGTITGSYEMRFLNSTGNFLIGEILTTPILNSANDVEILGIVRDVTERKRKDEIIRRSLREKEILLKEIHHRVKNNLQIISSLLKMQSQRFNDEKITEIFRETQNRIMSMSFIHQSFYQSSDLSEIDFNVYISKLAGNLYKIYNINQSLIKLEINTNHLSMGIDSAIPCGLMINEIISNSLKYAFINDSTGNVTIELNERDEMFILKIKDNGIGLSDSVKISDSTSLGMVLINMLCDQIDGNINLNTKNGTEYEIIFPKNRYGDRLKEVNM